MKRVSFKVSHISSKKLFIYFLSVLIIFNSCTLNNRNYINPNQISEVELLILDTNFLDLPSKQLTPLINVGDGQCFVDSSGKALHISTQKIIFTASQKDSLINIFNEFLKMHQPTTITTCIISYSHVFILRNKKNNINEQIDFAFNCPLTINYLHKGIVIQPDEDSSETELQKLVPY